MKLPKDILLIDFEGVKHPVQVGAVLLDKETLEEKDSFSSYIYTDLKDRTVKKSGITQEMLNDAPKPEEIGKMLYEKFGSNVFIASWVQSSDLSHFANLMSKANIDFTEGPINFSKYDYHVLDIWPIAYIHALKNGYTGGADSEELFQYFGAKPRDLHNALEDCKIAADVLRKIVL
jgi:DNA polymerase III epsilon subunit-like protein